MTSQGSVPNQPSLGEETIKPQLLSLSGRRTTSGNVDIQDVDVSSSAEANEDDSSVPSKEASAVEQKPSQQKSQSPSANAGEVVVETKLSATESPESVTNPTAGASQQQASSEEDEELQRAKAMALAIQNNPKMTPDEIRQLLAQTGGVTTQDSAQTTAPAPLIPGRLTNMIYQTTGLATTTSASAANTTTTAAGVNAFRERARGRLSDIMNGDIAKHMPTIPTIPTTFLQTEETPPPVEPKRPPPAEIKKEKSSSAKEVLKRTFRVTNPAKGIRTPPISPTNSGDKGTVAPGGNADQLPSIPTISESGDSILYPRKSAPIRISGIAWKRRGGMGKFSTTAAWERRRIELQGSKLLYYSRDASEEDSNSPLDVSEDILSSLSSSNTMLNDSSQDQVSEGVVVTKRATWLEQAASKWVAGSDDPTSPRGYIDLEKEKASVQVSFGGSGAPSPFAISIKVGGETKWKLCFDYHKMQMEWFAALADIVVQTSVDSYNALLLQSADPTLQSELAMFRPPEVGQPPSSRGAVEAANRLWMTDSYVVSRYREGRNQDDPNETNNLPDMEDDTTERNNTSVAEGVVASSPILIDFDTNPEALEDVTDRSTKAWVVPEKNIVYVVSIFNVALLYARNSYTTMEGFWYLVVISNLATYLCLNKVPEWRSCLKAAQEMTGKVASITSGNLSSAAATESSTGVADSRSIGAVAAKESSSTGNPSSSGYIPEAGCSAMEVENTTDTPVNDKGEHFTAWRKVKGESLMVRSHGYLSTKAKVPSPGELFELVRVDVFESPQRYPDMAPRVKLPQVKFEDGDQPKTWHTPDTFIIGIALPTDPPKLGRSSSDGGGYTITMYYQMKQSTRDILRRVTADGYDPTSEKVDDPQKSQVNAVRLLEEWCRRAPTDDNFQARFKIVPNAHNLKEIGMPSWISKYNGKPFLIKRPGQTGFLVSHPELSCMVFDVSLHPFPYLAKQAICFMKENYFKKVLVTFGFVIEGRADDEVSYSALEMASVAKKLSISHRFVILSF